MPTVHSWTLWGDCCSFLEFSGASHFLETSGCMLLIWGRSHIKFSKMSYLMDTPHRVPYIHQKTSTRVPNVRPI